MSHQFTVNAAIKPTGLVGLAADGLPDFNSGPPAEFGGSGQEWSPEDLLVAAVADCFVLTFKAIATASRFEWIDLNCEVTGTLDKIERAMQFTEINVKASLTVSPDADRDRANRLLEKSENACFITNSLKVDPTLEIEIRNP